MLWRLIQTAAADYDDTQEILFNWQLFHTIFPIYKINQFTDATTRRPPGALLLGYIRPAPLLSFNPHPASSLRSTSSSQDISNPSNRLWQDRPSHLQQPFSTMAEEESFFPYNANKPAAILFTVLFGLTLLAHIFQSSKQRALFMLPLIIATLMQVVGYATRYISIIKE